jgi:hypothetical protein
VESGGQRELRVGSVVVVVDVVGYGGRPPLVQELVQQRPARLVRAVPAEAGLELAFLDHQWTGVGVIVLLPRDGDPTNVLPVLLRPPPTGAPPTTASTTTGSGCGWPSAPVSPGRRCSTSTASWTVPCPGTR